MIDCPNFYEICVTIFYPMALATAFGQKPKFVRAKHSATVEHSAMAEGENCANGPTLMALVRYELWSVE